MANWLTVNPTSGLAGQTTTVKLTPVGANTGRLDRTGVLKVKIGSSVKNTINVTQKAAANKFSKTTGVSGPSGGGLVNISITTNCFNLSFMPSGNTPSVAPQYCYAIYNIGDTDNITKYCAGYKFEWDKSYGDTYIEESEYMLVSSLGLMNDDIFNRWTSGEIGLFFAVDDFQISDGFTVTHTSPSVDLGKYEEYSFNANFFIPSEADCNITSIQWIYRDNTGNSQFDRTIVTQQVSTVTSSKQTIEITGETEETITINGTDNWTIDASEQTQIGTPITSGNATKTFKVMEEDGEPIMGATLQVVGQSTGATTNENGIAILTLTGGVNVERQIRVDFIGHQVKEVTVSIAGVDYIEVTLQELLELKTETM